MGMEEIKTVKKRRAKRKPLLRMAQEKAVVVKTELPEELEMFWDNETEKAWRNLNPKNQKFFLKWVSNGNRGADAYRSVYNPLASDNVASVGACQILRNNSLSIFLDRLADNNKLELLKAKKVYLDGMKAFKPVWNPEKDSALDVEDHKTRRECADSLMKLNGQLVEISQKKVDVNVHMSNEFTQNLYTMVNGLSPGKPYSIPDTKAGKVEKVISPRIEMIAAEEPKEFDTFSNQNAVLLDMRDIDET